MHNLKYNFRNEDQVSNTIAFVYSELSCWFYTISNLRSSWSWSYNSWIYNYLCNQCLSPLTLWVQILL